MGRSRAVLTRDYRYLFAPPAPGRGGSGAGGGTFGAEGRHPAYASDEQLYDQRADPVRLPYPYPCPCPCPGPYPYPYPYP